MYGSNFWKRVKKGVIGPANGEDIDADGGDVKNVGSLSTDGSINNRVQVIPGDNVQSKLDQAGAGGTVEFAPGTYHVSSALTPHNGQTWDAGESVIFQPTTDTDVINASNVHNWDGGSFHIADPNANQTSKAGLFLDDTVGCSIDRIHCHNTYNSIRTTTSSDGTKQNEFGKVYLTSVRYRGIWLGGQTHDNHFDEVWIDGAPGSSHGVLINTSGIDGGNMFSKILTLNMGGDGFQVATLHREFWIGQIIADSNGSYGFNHFAGGNRSFFINSLWGSGNGQSGVRFAGGSPPVNDGQISQIYAIGNGNEGVSVGGTNGLQVGRIIARGNSSQGFIFQGGNSSKNAFITHIETGAAPSGTPGANGTGVDFSGAGNNVTVLSYNAPDGTNAIDNIYTAPGSNPRGWAATTPSLPSGTGSTNSVTNSNPYPVLIYQSGASGTHVIDPLGNDKALPADDQPITLDPGAQIYYATTVASAWNWYGK